MFKWVEGRRKTGYCKMPLLINNFILPFDVYILKFPEGCEVRPHIDTVSGFRHFRLNLILKKAKIGGEFFCETSYINTPRIKIFRPDKYVHSVSKVEKGCRYVLSIGWVLK